MQGKCSFLHYYSDVFCYTACRFSSLDGNGFLPLILLLKVDVLDVEGDLGAVLEGHRVGAELLELLNLPVRRVHLPVQVQSVLRGEDLV